MKKLLFLLAFTAVIGCAEKKPDTDNNPITNNKMLDSALNDADTGKWIIVPPGYFVDKPLIDQRWILDTTFTVNSDPRPVKIHRMMFVKDLDTTTIDTVHNKAFHSKQIFVNGIFQGCIVGD